MKINNRGFLAAVGVLVFLFAGMVYAWAVMSSPIAQEFPDWTKAELSMTFTIVMMFFCIGCMISGFIADRVPERFHIWLAAVLFLGGFILASQVQSYVALYVSFGVICGLGSGFAYSAVLSSVTKWFPDKRGMISGILMMGFGLSSFIVGKIYQAVTPADIGGWRTSFLWMGIITAIVFVICGIFIRRPGADFTAPAAAPGKKKLENPVSMEAAPGQMLRKPAFWLYFFWVFLLTIAGLSITSQATGMSNEVNSAIDGGTVATVVGLISVCNGISRVFMGTLYDKKGRSFVMQLVNTMFIITGIVFIVAFTTGNYAILVVSFILGGASFGGVNPTNSAFMMDYYGMKNYPKNFSIVNTNLIVSSFGATIAGSLYDNFGSYLPTYIMIIGVAVGGVIVSLLISLCDRSDIKKMGKGR